MLRAFIKGDQERMIPATSVPSEGEWTWIDVEDPTEQEIFDLARRYDLEPILVEDLLAHTEFPKHDDYGAHLLVVLHGMRFDDSGRVTTHEVDAVLTPTALITFHREHVDAIEWMIGQAMESQAMAAGGPDELLARLAEVMARRLLPVIDELDNHIESLEDLAMEAHPSVVLAVQALRRDVIRLRRVLAPQREVAMSLSRDGLEVVHGSARRRFSDVYDHLYRIVESLDTARALLSSVIDTYRSTVAENMNDVMKVLTVFSAILLPLSLMAGIYGMNFANIPELSWRWAYFGLLGVMATTALALWIYFSRRGFIGGPKLSNVTKQLERGVDFGLKSVEAGARGIGHGLRGVATLGTAPIRIVTAGIRALSESEQGDEGPMRMPDPGVD